MKSSGQGRGPYWPRAHKDWRFWAVLLLMLAAMGVYVTTNDLAWRPKDRRPVLAVMPAN